MSAPRSMLTLSLVLLACQDPTGQDVGGREASDVQAAAPSEPEHPGPPAPVAGLRGITTISNVVFDQAPEAPNRFETNYIFPGRARWELSAGETSRREYRFGSSVYVQEPGSSASTPYAGGDLEMALRRMELRRAVLLYPDGFEWTDAEDESGGRVTPVGAGARRIGELLARVDALDRLLSMSVHWPDGTEQESLEVLAWRTEGERSWPMRLRLTSQGQGVWTESVEVVDASSRYIDDFFVPVDQRAAGVSAGSGIGIQRVDVPSLTLKAFALPDGVDWTEARRRAEALVAAESAKAVAAGRELDPIARYELDARGRPTSVLLNLRGTVEPPAEGWRRLEGRVGLMFVIGDPRKLTKARLDEMLSAVPDTARVELGYARFVGQTEGERLQVVVSLVPR